jgi:peptidoglycan/LPS O-acetylase OafA/YrhL
LLEIHQGLSWKATINGTSQGSTTSAHLPHPWIVYHAFQLISAKLIHDVPFDPCQDWVISSNPLFALITEGHTAVGLFMVLSRFVLARATIGSEVDYWKFIKNRMLRIYPLFVAIVLAGSR